MIIKVDNHVLLILHVNLAAVCRYVMHCKCRSEEFVIPDPISSLSHSNFIYHVVLDLKKKKLKIISLQSALFNDLLKFAIQYINKKITTLFLFFFLLFLQEIDTPNKDMTVIVTSIHVKWNGNLFGH